MPAPDVPPPRVSILIPNFNNGRESSRAGARDFIGDLFRSLLATLEDDPTPVEILVADDGSTDDSRETCRAWADRTWRGGEPFCRLVELEHCGVLSIVANQLTAMARGDLCCRLDGDVVVLTPRWAARIVRAFEQGPPTLGVVGPKQLAPDGRVHAAGDWVLHPRGYHHVAQGAPAAAVHRTREVDHVMGCFYCHRRVVWEQLGGYDETILRGQTVDFGLRARLHGWRAFAVPDVEFIHAHTERVPRTTTADTKQGIRRHLDRFAEKWGFDRVAPDLDVVAERYAGTPLLWNPRVFGPRAPFPPRAEGPRDIRHSAWARYATDEGYRAAVDARVAVVEGSRGQLGPNPRLLDVGCRSGLFAHLLARRGLAVVGVDGDPQEIDLARQACGGERYPGPVPQFTHQPEGRELPLEDGTVDAVLLFDVLESHPNPVGLLAEARRVLSEDGLALLVARQRTPPYEVDDEAAPAYRAHELVIQVQASRSFRPATLAGLPEIPGALTLLGRRVSEPPARYEGRVEAGAEVVAGVA